MSEYRFSVGPWNISEGRDPYGPEMRPTKELEWKLERFRDAGFDTVMFHDDDVVPGLEDKSHTEVIAEAEKVRAALDNAGMSTEFVAPRLWFHPLLVDGGFTSHDPKARAYSIERAMQVADIARVLGTDFNVWWLAREGTYLREAKSHARALEQLVEAVDALLVHDSEIRLAIEPKPNEPVDVAYLPTIGHALAFAHLTRDPSRVGCLVETAHAILVGLDPADEMEFALAQNKLWSVHINDQNGLKFDQDKPFGSVNLRSAFDQVRVLERHDFADRGCIGIDVHSFRTTTMEHALDHLTNSRRTFERLVEKARTFDDATADALIADRNYQALDQMVIDHLLGA